MCFFFFSLREKYHAGHRESNLGWVVWVEINEPERIKEKWIKRNEDHLRDLQDNIKRSLSIN